MGVTESHREPERDRERASKSHGEPQREPVRARLNKTLFCRNTSKYGIFLSKIVKIHDQSQKKLAASALRADSTLSPTLSHSSGL